MKQLFEAGTRSDEVLHAFMQFRFDISSLYELAELRVRTPSTVFNE